MRFGLSTFLFYRERLVREHLEAMAAHGFTDVELFCMPTHFDYHDPKAVEALAGWLEATKLTLHSVHAPIVDGFTGTWGGVISNATSDAAARAHALRETEAAAALAATLPYQHLVVHLGQPDEQSPPPTDNQRDAARRSAEQLYETTSRHGVRLALEIIPNKLSTAERLLRLIDDELELADAGICLDFGHANIIDDVTDVVEAVSGHLVTTHVHDNDGKHDDHLVPFEGRIDWPRVLFATQKVGYEGAWMMELFDRPTTTDVLKRAQAACHRFRDILAS